MTHHNAIILGLAVGGILLLLFSAQARKRTKAFLEGEVEAILGACGGSAKRTISGTAGRACGYGGGKPRWWGPALRGLIEVMPWFGAGHCERCAILEEAEPK
jgi:hypothetical protein